MIAEDPEQRRLMAFALKQTFINIGCGIPGDIQSRVSQFCHHARMFGRENFDTWIRDLFSGHQGFTIPPFRCTDIKDGAMNLYQLGLEYLKVVESPKIQSPSGKPGDGGCRQSPCDATPRRKAKRGRSYGKERNACTTGQSQAHQSSADG